MAEDRDGLVEERPSRRVMTYLDDIAWCKQRLAAIEDMLWRFDLPITPSEASHLMLAASELEKCRDSLATEVAEWSEET